jgi:hypothetical protein
MKVKTGITISLLFVVLFCYSVFGSSNNFLNLNDIVNNKNISFEEARQKIEVLFSELIDPSTIKSLILQSSRHARLIYGYSQKQRYERYDEAVYIGVCRLVQINTSESIRELVELIQYDLGVSNNEVLGQRITEIGRLALIPLQTKLKQLKKKEAGYKEESRTRVSKKIGTVQNYIDSINEGRKIDAGVGPCPAR